MTVTTSYPGVYIDEIPSGVRTITGVATSVTAFIGRAERGPTDAATLINSFAEFQRTFGSYQMYAPMAFAVRDFYLNGGSQAVIVRLFNHDSSISAADKSAITLKNGSSTVTLTAANPGLWGRQLRATLDWNTSAASATALGVGAHDIFNLTVQDAATGATEIFRNLTLVTSARRIDHVIAAESALVTFKSISDGALPLQSTPTSFTNKAATDTVADEVTKASGASAKAQAMSDMGGQDGKFLSAADNFTKTGNQGSKLGLYALDQADLFNILVIPPYTNPNDDVVSGGVETGLVSDAAAYCETRRAMLIVDPLPGWSTKKAAVDDITNASDKIGTRSKNAALYFPRVSQANPLRENRVEDFVPSGAVAGVWARTDATRGVWKAPAGLDAALVGVPELDVVLTDSENGDLNPLGINCLRVMPAAGRIVWGARTLQGDDRLASEWKYIPVRRTALFIEESLYRGTQWVVFEPNDEPLWAQIRMNVGAFMQGLFRQGAFQGKTPREAYFVKCDKETTTQDDVNKGIVNIVVGFAPLKPAEFVIIRIQQMAGQVAA
jgi:phage tail sheath protein FI